MKNIIKPSFSDLYMRNVQDEMNKIMEDAFGNIDLFDVLNEKHLWRPPMEMSETEKEYTVSLQLPGFNAKDIDIEIGSDYITVRAENSFEKEQKKKNLYRSEFRYGNFMRTVSFPSNIDSEHTNAEFTEGVLVVNVPKMIQRNQRKTLSVKAKPTKAIKQKKAKKTVQRTKKAKA